MYRVQVYKFEILEQCERRMRMRISLNKYANSPNGNLHILLI